MIIDALPKLESRYWWVHFGGGLGTQTDPNKAVYLAPVKVSFCGQEHGETRARVPHSVEILIPRSCG